MFRFACEHLRPGVHLLEPNPRVPNLDATSIKNPLSHLRGFRYRIYYKLPSDYFLADLRAACAAAKRAIGTRKGEQLT